MKDTIQLTFRVGAGRARPVFANLARLGVLNVGRHWDGRPYFELPNPFNDVRVIDGETFTAEKRARVQAAFQYFAAFYGENT